MPFSTDYSDIKDGGGILPIGEYEVIIKYAGEDHTKSGTVYINVTTVIRNDVEQKFKNKNVWHEIWHRKDPSPADLACGGYSSKQINSLSKAAGLPNNKKYESLSEWCEDLRNKPVRITVEHEEYEGKTRAKVKWVNESHCLPCGHAWKSEEPAGTFRAASPGYVAVDGPGDFREITDKDDDLPF